MKHFTSLAFGLLAFFLSNAQFETFDLSKYKLPEIERHQLDFTLEHNNNYQGKSQGNRNGNFFQLSEFDLKNNINGLYSYYLNSGKIQMEGLVTLSTEIELDWQRLGDVPYDKNDNYTYALDARLDRRMYLKGEDRWFFLWSPSLYVRRYSDYVKVLEEYDTPESDRYFSRELYFQPGIKLGGGFGRIEPVGDLRRAVYIYEDLFENDCLQRLPTEKEVLQLANKIAQLRNQRFFDSRLRSIYEIKSLDSLLNNQGLTSETDATYFTSLNDMWLYGNEERYSGTRIQFDVSGQLQYSYDKTKTENYEPGSEIIRTENTEKQYNNLLGLGVLLDSHKPKGLKWQRNFLTHIFFNRFYRDINNPSQNNYHTFWGSVSYGYDWFMNTRTSASFGVRGQFNRYDYFNADENIYNNNSVHGFLNGNLNYYFSPRLKAALRLTAVYSWSENTDVSYFRGLNFNSQIGINYAIF